MTIEFKIGHFYRTRAGTKVYLYGIRQSGDLCFETESGDSFLTELDGRRYLNESVPLDIVSKWREPHVHECEVWADLIDSEPDPKYEGPWEKIFGKKFRIVSDKNSFTGLRKFKVRVEEVLE